MDEAWSLIRENIDTDSPVGADKFLGCYHRVFDAPDDAFEDCLPGHVTGERIMPDGEKKPTFVTKRDANKANQTSVQSDSHSKKKTKGTKTPKMCRYMEYDMEDFFKSCIERY